MATKQRRDNKKRGGGGGGKTYIISLDFETASRRLFPCGNSQCLPNGDPRNPFSNMWIALLTTRALQKTYKGIHVEMH